MIDIKPFTIKVTPKESKILQEILFANGYCWGSCSNKIEYLNEAYLVFECYGANTTPRLRYTGSYDYSKPRITFEYFTNTYDIKKIRKEKLRKLNHDRII